MPSETKPCPSAIAPMPTLWVMTIVVVPSSRLARASSSSTRTPVVLSSAPVGSSQSSTAVDHGQEQVKRVAR